MVPTLVLCDFDGVLRHFDTSHRDRCEDRHGLERGALEAAAFEPALLTQAVTGGIDRATWTATIGQRVGSPEAAAEWLAERGAIDPAMMELVDDLRHAGVRVAVLTNGTDTFTDELVHFGIEDRFDGAFSTWHVGYAKPDIRAFRHVTDALDVDPAEVAFTDDSPSKLSGADELGMATHHFTGVAGLRNFLRDRGLST